MISILIRHLFVSLVSLALIAVSLVLWKEERLVQKVSKGKVEIDSNEFQSTLGWYGTRHLRLALYTEYTQETVPPEYLVKVAESYLKRHPLDAKVWLWSSVFNYRAKNYDVANKHLSNAHQLSLNHSSNLEKVFNRYVEIGKYEDALEVAKSISYAKPRAFRRLFYLMGRLYSDYDTLVEKMIPSSPQNSRDRRPAEFEDDYYYNVAMNDAIRVKNVELSNAVWLAAPGNLKASSKFGLRYIEFLVNMQESLAMKAAWAAQSKIDLVPGELSHQSFSEKNTPCWNLIPVKNGTVSYDVSSAGLREELSVEFLGLENISFSHARCMLLLNPNTRYILSGEWRGENLTTLSGPYFDIYAPNVKNSYTKSEARVGSWPWQEFDLEFASGEASAYILRLRRAKTTYLDSKISGILRIRDLRIRQLSSEYQTEPQRTPATQ